MRVSYLIKGSLDPNKLRLATLAKYTGAGFRLNQVVFAVEEDM